MKKIIFIALMMSGCSQTLPVRGSLQQSEETFIGSATGYMDGSGTLTVNTNTGTNCVGDFTYINQRQGDGIFECSDGRSGPFKFTSTGNRGTGTGSLDGQPFVFTFGN